MKTSPTRRVSNRRLGAGLGLALMTMAPTATAKPGTQEAREVLLSPVRIFGHAVWFADELAPIADAVAEVLARPKLGGFRVVPPPETRALWAGVQQGHLPEWKEDCTAPPPPALLGEHLHPRALTGGIDVRCTKRACKLVVEIHGRDKTAGSERGYVNVARLGADLPTRETPAEWAVRLRRTGLAPKPWPREMGGLGLSGLVGGNQDRTVPEAVVTTIHQSGDWAYTLDGDFFAPKTKELGTCAPAERVWRDWWTQSAVIAVNGDGRMSRCEPDLPDHLPPPEFACFCQVLAHVGFKPGAGDRRASFEIHILAPTKRAARDRYFRTAYLTAKHADDTSAILGTGEVDNTELVACLAKVTTEVRDTKIPLHFTVAADGLATPARPTWPPTLPRSVTACLDGVLARARFNCPVSGHAEVDADLSIAVVLR